MRGKESRRAYYLIGFKSYIKLGLKTHRGARRGLPQDWLNDAAKAYFHADPPREPVLGLSHLRVWAPRADYMLAMKCASARFDSHDRDDVLFLIRYLGLKKPEAVFKLIEKYYPRRLIPPKTRFLVEELL